METRTMDGRARAKSRAERLRLWARTRLVRLSGDLLGRVMLQLIISLVIRFIWQMDIDAMNDSTFELVYWLLIFYLACWLMCAAYLLRALGRLTSLLWAYLGSRD